MPNVPLSVHLNKCPLCMLLTLHADKSRGYPCGTHSVGIGTLDTCGHSLKGQQSHEATTGHSGNKRLGDLKEQGGSSPGKSENCILDSGERECKRPVVGANLGLGWGVL